MAGAPTNHLNKPYANMYSATDPRFFFPTAPADGSILYYSTVYNKWTGSDPARFKWNAATNTVSLNGTFEVTGSVKFNDNDPAYTQYFNMINFQSVWSLYSNQPIFQVGYNGNVSIQGSNAGLTLFERSGISYYQFFNDAGTLRLNYSGTNISTISSSGVTTLVPTRVQTTAQTTGTFYVPFVPLATTQTAGQVVSVHSGLSYNVGTSTLTTTNFSGLASSSTAITTTTQPAATTYFLTMANAGTGGTSKSIFVDTGITWNNGTDTLTATNFSGLASSSTAITTTTQPAATTYFLTMANSGTGGTSKSIFVDTGITWNNGTDTLTVTNLAGLASSASAVTTTTAGTGTFFPVFTTDGTGGTSRVLSVDAGLSYVASTDTLTCGTFVGSLTGSATLIDTTNNTGASTQFLTFVPLASTQSAGQVVSTSSSLGYVPSTGTLTATVFSGSLTGSATLIDTTLIGPFGVMYIPLVVNSATSPAGQTVYTNTVLNFNTTNNTLTATNIVAGSFTGSLTGSASLIDTTEVGTNALYYIPFVPLATTQTAGQVLGTDVGLTYNPGTNAFEIFNGSIRVTDEAIFGALYFSDVNTPANQFQIYHANGSLLFNNQWSPLPRPLDVNGDGLGVTAYNIQAKAYEPAAAVQLDSPSIRDANDQGVLFEANTANDYSAIPTQTGTTWSIVVSGHNPNSRELTFSFGVSSTHNLVCNGTAGLSQSFAPTFNTVTCTRNGGAFTAFSYETNIGSTTSFAYSTTNVGPLNTYQIRQPLTQYTIKFIPTNSSTTDTYVFTIGITYAYTSTAGYTWSTVSTTRNPTDFTYNASRLPGGTGSVNFTPGASPAGTSMISAKTLTKDFAQVSSRTLECDYLQAQYVGLVGEYTLTGTSGTLLRCFRGNYEHYEIQLRFTSAPTQGTRFTVELAFANGTPAAASYLGSLTSTGAVLTFASYGVSTGAILFSVAGTNRLIYTAKIYSPNLARATTFQAMNIGSDATNVNVPFLSTGFHNQNTAYGSIRWATTNSINASILFRGFN